MSCGATFPVPPPPPPGVSRIIGIAPNRGNLSFNFFRFYLNRISNLIEEKQIQTGYKKTKISFLWTARCFHKVWGRPRVTLNLFWFVWIPSTYQSSYQVPFKIIGDTRGGRGLQYRQGGVNQSVAWFFWHFWTKFRHKRLVKAIFTKWKIVTYNLNGPLCI